ncbi:hypothetical protein LCGC14_2410770 [marine sediment metagenome]|uniref:Major capsid protein n=1 Tax=marine sediment metagenome TaxID=412755 RepID=A0A0F9EM12_9ZZZZ
MSNFSVANSTGVTDGADFIPEVWALETVAAYKSNLVLAQLVSLIPHVGKKGDVIHIPFPTRGAATAKSENVVVSVINMADSVEKSITINQHFHYARLIEDRLEIQGLPSLRRFFTDDAGYALAKQTDSSLIGLAATWGGSTAYLNSGTADGGAKIGDGTTAWVQTGSGNGSAISDAGVREIVQDFDDEDVPSRDRYLVIPPVEKKRMLGNTRYTEQAFVGEVGMANSIRNGLVGDLYGFEIYVSSNLATVQSSDCTNYRPALFFQRDSLALAEQLTPRVQEQYKLEALGDLIVADSLYGVATLRGNVTAERGRGARAIMVPAA